MDVFEKVKAITVEILDCDPRAVVNEARFIEDLGATLPLKDRIISKFEEEYEIDIRDDDGNGLTTIGLAVDYIKEAIR